MTLQSAHFREVEADWVERDSEKQSRKRVLEMGLSVKAEFTSTWGWEGDWRRHFLNRAVWRIASTVKDAPRWGEESILFVVMIVSHLPALTGCVLLSLLRRLL